MDVMTRLIDGVILLELRIESEDPVGALQAIFELVFGVDARLSFRIKHEECYDLTLAGPSGWQNYDRRHNNTSESHANKVVAWRKGLGYEALARVCHPSHFEGATRMTAYLLTRVWDDDIPYLHIVPAFA